MKILRGGSVLFLAAVFLWAAVDKLLHFGGFVHALDGYLVVPRGGGRFLAMPLILAELGVGVTLLLPSLRVPAARLATALLVLFTAAVGINARWAPGSACGCWFTLTLGEASTAHVLQDLVFLGLAASIWIDERARRTSRRPSSAEAASNPTPPLDTGKEVHP